MERWGAAVAWLAAAWVALNVAAVVARVGLAWLRGRLSALAGAAILTAEAVGLAVALLVAFLTHSGLLAALRRAALPREGAATLYYGGGLLAAVAFAYIYYRFLHPRVLTWFLPGQRARGDGR